MPIRESLWSGDTISLLADVVVGSAFQVDAGRPAQRRRGRLHRGSPTANPGPYGLLMNDKQALFNGKAQCARCHVPPLFTEPGFNMHTPEELGIDDFQASRSPTRMYRTPPLKGLFSHQKGGFLHDRRFPDLRSVVEHYDSNLKTGLTDAEKADLVAYLRTL